MSLGKLLTLRAPAVTHATHERNMQYVVTNTITGESGTFTVVDSLSPDWASSHYGAAMGIPGAWRAVILLSDLIGQLPWHAYRDRGDNPTVRINPDPPLLDQPAPPDPRMSTFSSWTLDLIWEGNAIGIVAARNQAGWPTALLPVPARSVFARRVTAAVDSPLPLGAIEYKIGSMTFGSGELMHIKGPCAPGAVRGLGVLEAHMRTLQLADDQARQARSIANHGVPTGLLKATSPDVTVAELAAAKAQWLANQRDRTVQAIGPSTEFEPLSWNPEQMELVEARKFTLTELELVFGLPVGWLGGQTSSRTYSNIEQDAVNLLKFTLGGHVGRFEGNLSLLFPRGTMVKANLDAILRADTLTRYQAHAIALGNKPFMEVDEVRELENRGPMPEPQLPPIQAQAVVGGQPAAIGAAAQGGAS
jgi:HK97 family phage portal protein